MTPRCAARRRLALLVQVGAAEPWPSLATPLAEALPAGWRVAQITPDGAAAMRAACQTLISGDVDEVVAILLHPQFRADLLTPIVRALYAAVAERAPHLGVTVRTAWHDDAGYVQALAGALADRIRALPPEAGEAHLRFVLPAPPDGPDGERWWHQAHQTAELVATRLGWPADGWSLGDPGTPPAATGRVLEARLPFPDRPTAEDPGPWVGVLRHLVLHGPQPPERAAPPLLGPRPATDAPATLVMLGACLANSLGSGAGPALCYSEQRAFASRPHSRKVLRACLDRLHADAPGSELLLWSTCQRVELYAWIPDALGPAARTCLEDRLRGTLFGAPSAGLALNVLRDHAARHHLLRTACGLNSGLPGDRDVAAQLETACRMSEAAGTAGPRTRAQVAEAVALAHDLHAGAPWGQFSTGYCAAALTRVCEVDGLRFDRLRHVVIGGSSTSRSILSTLVQEHGVPCRQLTLVYRDHHGQMRQLRAALGGGRRLRVHTYADDAVLRAIADADLVFFGIDQADPVLDAAAVAVVRDAHARPLTLVDFNGAGSLTNVGALGPVTLWSARELDRAVAAQAAVTISRSGFGAALEDAEARIALVVAGATRGGAVADPAPGLSASSGRSWRF